MSESRSPAERNTLELPRYTYRDAARYLRVPLWVVAGYARRSPEMFYRFWDVPFRVESRDDVDFPDGREADRLSFHSLANLFIATAIFRHADELPLPRRHFAEMVWNLADRLGDDPRLLADPEWVSDQVERVFWPMAEADRSHVQKLVVLHQSRVESRDGVPVQLFPFSREPAADAPRVVVIDPDVRFGRPTVKGAPTDVLVDRWRAGDRASDLAEDYGLTTDEVEEALRYEAGPPGPLDFMPFPLPY